MVRVTHRLEAHVLGESDWIAATAPARRRQADTRSGRECQRRGAGAGAAGSAARARAAYPQSRAPGERSLTEAPAPLAQPFFFCGRVRAAEHPVTVRKAAELLDDRAVILGRTRRRGEGSAQFR